MSVDEIVKLILAISLAFAIVGIAYALIKFILSCTAVVDEAKKPVSNIGELSDLALEDYKNLRTVIQSITKILTNISSYLENPILLIKKFSALASRNSKSQL